MKERGTNTETSPSVAVIITAAGKSSRMSESKTETGGDTKSTKRKKEYLPLPDAPSVLARTVSVFLSAFTFSNIVITHPEGGTKGGTKGGTEEAEEARSALGELSNQDCFRFCAGGGTRQESVRKGLETLTDDPPRIVLIHDAARPWVSPRIIREVIATTLKHGAAAPVVSPRDAIKRIDSEGWFTRHFSREDVFAVQTPQGFTFSEILYAHQKAKSDGKIYIDDTEIYQEYAGKVKSVEGDPENRKITYSHDLPGNGSEGELRGTEEGQNKRKPTGRTK